MKTYIRIRQICNLSFHAVCTAHNHDVFFCVAAVKEAGNQISFRQNFLAAYRTAAFSTPFRVGITVRTAHNVHPLVWSVHRAEDHPSLPSKSLHEPSLQAVPIPSALLLVRYPTAWGCPQTMLLNFNSHNIKIIIINGFGSVSLRNR